MARKNRVWYPGAIYHVMNRGNRKDLIYKDEGDYYFFLKQVNDAKKVYPFTIHALCLMPNHFHVLMETENVELGKIMSKILSTYVPFFNRKHSYCGHLFGDRYKSVLIETDASFLEVSRYIHLNPVKAMMVKSPLDYEYSSYKRYALDRDERTLNHVDRCIESIVDTSRILSMFGDDKDQYRKFIENRGHSPFNTTIGDCPHPFMLQ